MDEMNIAEIAVKQAEEKTLLKAILILRDSKSVEEAEKKIRTLLEQ